MTDVAAGVREIEVGIGQMSVEADPDAVLVARGLGSCVGLAAFDPVARVGALIHIMLPQRKPGAIDDDNPYKYADTGIAAMLAAMQERGALLSRVVLKATGGACMVSVPGFGERFRIGERNSEAIRDILQQRKLKLAAEDMGGRTGRTLRLHLTDGAVTVQSIGQPPETL